MTESRTPSYWRRTQVVACAAVVLALSALTVSWLVGSRAGLYRGKTVREWSSLVFAPEPRASNATAALRAMGAAAVPELTRLLKARDPLLRKPVRVAVRLLPVPLASLFSRYVGAVPAASVHLSAARSLGIIGPAAKAAVPGLLQALRGSDQGFAWEAALALSRIGPESLPGLAQATAESSPNTRWAAVVAIGQLRPGTRDGIQTLVRALDDADPRVRVSAAYSLSQLGLPAIAPLLEVVSREEGSVRETAGAVVLRVYNSWPPPGAGSTINVHDPEREARQSALKALAESKPTDELTQQVFSGALRDPASSVRLVALRHLSPPSTNATPLLVGLALCLTDESAEVRELAVRNLEALGGSAKPVVSRLTLLLNDPDDSVRAAAREALKKLDQL